jgi:hypothetical protein
MRNCKSNLYAFGVSEFLPPWEWSHHPMLKHITGLGNILQDEKNFMAFQTEDSPNTLRRGQKTLSKISPSPAHPKSSQPSVSKIEDPPAETTFIYRHPINNHSKEINFLSIHAGESFCLLETETFSLCGFGTNDSNL